LKTTKLRKQLRSIMQEQIDKNPNITSEGLLSSVRDHILAVLKKSNQAVFDSELDALAKSSPEGAAAAKHLIDLLDSSEDWIENSKKHRAKLLKI
jgi:hypothetical protein